MSSFLHLVEYRASRKMRWSIGSTRHLLTSIDGQALSIVQPFNAPRLLYLDRLSFRSKQSDDLFDRVSQVLNFRTTDSRMRTVVVNPGPSMPRRSRPTSFTRNLSSFALHMPFVSCLRYKRHSRLLPPCAYESDGIPHDSCSTPRLRLKLVLPFTLTRH